MDNFFINITKNLDLKEGNSSNANSLENVLNVFNVHPSVQRVKRSIEINQKKYFFLLNKHDQKLINILENQKIYGGFLKILIFWVSLSRIHLQSKTFLLYIQGYYKY